MKSMLARILSVLLLALSLGGGAQAAEGWPARQPVRIIVPVAPGGSSDVLGRLVAQKLSGYFGQQFVVENRVGAGGTLGSALVTQAAPDGYTLLVSGIGTLVISPAVVDPKPYDLSDFTQIATFGGPPTVLIVGKDVPVKSLKELIDYAKTHRVTHGLPGVGSHAQLIVELFRQKAGIELTPVPYNGAGPAMTDLLGGQIPMASTTLVSASEQIKSGLVRALAISSPKRLPAYPDIPTYAEQGYPDLSATTWFSLSGPAKMPADVVDKLNAGVRRAFQEPDMVQRLERDAIYPEPFTAQQFSDFVKAEFAKWGPLAKAGSALQ